MDQTLVSIIITNYNYQEYVVRAINSVLSQTYRNIELIVLNDGSTDNSDDIIRNFIENYQGDILIRYINQNNMGIMKTRNEGLSLSTGDYLAFLDADDYYDKDYIEQMLKVAYDSSADVVFPNWRIVDEHGNQVSIRKFGEYDIMKHQLQQIHLKPESLVKKAAIGNIEYRSEVLAEDWEFFLHLAFEHKKIVNAPEVFINYYVHANSRATSHDFYQDYVIYQQILDVFRKSYPSQTINYQTFEKEKFKVVLEQDQHIKNYQKNEQLLKQIIHDNAQEIECQKNELENSRQENVQILFEKKQLLAEYETLNQQYQSIIYSRTWKVRTKIVQFIKWILRRNK